MRQIDLNKDYDIDESYLLSGDGEVESIKFPLVSSLHYIELVDLQNIVELDIPGDVIWLKCLGLQKLKEINLGGNLKWLVLRGLDELRSLDLSDCKHLEMLSVEGIPALQNLKIKGCNKLRQVEGLDEFTMKNLKVKEQLQENKLASRYRAKIYDGMTADDIDLVLSTINAGVKVLNGISLSGAESLDDHYEIRLLAPMEDVYTGGTGERYSHEFAVGRIERDDCFSITHSMGCHSPEDCLLECLRWMRNFVEVPGCNDYATEEEMLDYLRTLVAS